MGTRSVPVSGDWVLLGPTPLEVESHSTFDVMIAVADAIPTDPSYPALRLRSSVSPSRIFDTPGMNVYARSFEDREVDVIVVPRASVASIAAMLAGLSGGLLTLNPENGDVMQQDMSGNGSNT